MTKEFNPSRENAKAAALFKVKRGGFLQQWGV